MNVRLLRDFHLLLSIGMVHTCRNVHWSVEALEVKQARSLCSLIVLPVINMGFSDTTGRKSRDTRAIKLAKCLHGARITLPGQRPVV